MSFLSNLFHKSVNAIQALNAKLIDWVGPSASAFEIAIANDVKTAFPEIEGVFYTTIKQLGNEAVQAVIASGAELPAIVAGTESFSQAIAHFETNLAKVGLNPASLSSVAKTALITASTICLKTFGPALVGAVASNPTSTSASQPAASSSASPKA